ncbi:MAG: sulfurtransferase complex subunit TusC [Ketobacteraceae bacterium]|nr:sulfurtransferase complex subunit TusC [Ketobacteraceae bacterium]
MEKHILFILSKPPYSTASARESTDAMMAACAFGQKVSILALGDSLFQFTSGQQAQALSLRNTAAMLASLPMYGTEHFYAREKDLSARNLKPDDFVLPSEPVTDGEMQSLVAAADVVLSY